MRLARRDVRDHIKYSKTDCRRSYRFYKPCGGRNRPNAFICEIFEAPRFSSFSTQSAGSGRSEHAAHRTRPAKSRSANFLRRARKPPEGTGSNSSTGEAHARPLSTIQKPSLPFGRRCAISVAS